MASGDDLSALERSIVVGKGHAPVRLTDRERVLLREGTLSKAMERSVLRKVPQRTLLLFDDMLVVCKDTGNPNKRPFKGVIQLAAASLRYGGFESTVGGYTMRVCGPGEDCDFTFFSTDRALIESWVRSIQGQMATQGLKAGLATRRGWQHALVKGTLFAAVTSGTLTDVKAAMAARDEAGDPLFDVNERDESGASPLWLASFLGASSVVSHLLGAGADAHLADNGLIYPLSLAAARGHVAVVDALLQGGARPGESLDEQERGPIAVVATLMASYNARKLAGDGPLPEDDEMGSRYGVRIVNSDRARECVLRLADAGADTNARDAFGTTPLLEAATLGDAEAAAMVLDAGADPSLSREDGRTPLHVTCEGARLPPSSSGSGGGGEPVARRRVFSSTLCSTLLGAGAQPNARDRGGATPLHLAVRADTGGDAASEAECAALLAVLQQHGARASIPDLEGVTPADDAAQRGIVLPVSPPRPAPPACAPKWADKLSPNPAPDWIGDGSSTTCLLCGTRFTFAVRRHHCRFCGMLVCGACSAAKFPLREARGASSPTAIPGSPPKAARACDGCYNKACTRASKLEATPSELLQQQLAKYGMAQAGIPRARRTRVIAAMRAMQEGSARKQLMGGAEERASPTEAEGESREPDTPALASGAASARDSLGGAHAAAAEARDALAERGERMEQLRTCRTLVG